MHIFGGFGLSLLDVDSVRCNGSEARRLVVVAVFTLRSVTVGNVGNEYVSCDDVVPYYLNKKLKY